MLEELKKYLLETPREEVLKEVSKIREEIKDVSSPLISTILADWERFYDPVRIKKITVSGTEKKDFGKPKSFFLLNLPHETKSSNIHFSRF